MKRRSYALVIGLFVALIAYTYALRYRTIETPPVPSLDSLPQEIGSYVGTTEAEDPEALTLLGADATLLRRYRDGSGQTMWLFIAYFGTQHENSQIHSPKHCYPGAGWNILDDASTVMELSADEVRVKRLTISNGAEEQLILYWFTSANGILTNEFALKWNQMKNSLLSRSQATAFVRFSTEVTAETEAGARIDLVRFAEALSPHIEELLRGAGAAPGPPNHASAGTASSERTQ